MKNRKRYSSAPPNHNLAVIEWNGCAMITYCAIGCIHRRKMRQHINLVMPHPKLPLQFVDVYLNIKKFSQIILGNVKNLKI